MTIQCDKLTINVGESELFIEVYDKDELMASGKAKVGDSCFVKSSDNKDVEMLWYGDEEKWVAQTNAISFIGKIISFIFDTQEDSYNKVIRVLNSDPLFNKEEYLRNNKVREVGV